MPRSSAICRTSRSPRHRQPRPSRCGSSSTRRADYRRPPVRGHSRAPSPISRHRSRALGDVVPAAAPGVAYAYSNANYLILGLIVGASRGNRMPGTLRTASSAPLAMTHASSRSSHRGVTWIEPGTPAMEFRSATRGRTARPTHLAARRVPHGQRLRPRTIRRSAGRWRNPRQSTVSSRRPRLRRCSKASQRWVSATRADTVSVGPTGALATSAWSGTSEAPRTWRRPCSSRRSTGSGSCCCSTARARLYELAHKPDLIGMAAFALLAGREPDGTIGFLYPAFDAAAILLLGWIAWRLVRTARRMPIVASQSARASLATCGSASSWRSGWTRSSSSSCSS